MSAGWGGEPTGPLKNYLSRLTVNVNLKGVLDVDTVKGCTLGMAARPVAGCYDLCYAKKSSAFYGYDFAKSVSRPPLPEDREKIERQVAKHPAQFFRIGTMGDPCHDWPLTVEVCEWLGKIKTPVIITKHWKRVSDAELARLAACKAIINTSISALDTEAERIYRLKQIKRIADAGVKSVARIVSCYFGITDDGQRMAAIQRELFELRPFIDNPLRIPFTDIRVKRGDILAERHKDLGGGSTVSIAMRTAYLGHCSGCPDQCGVTL